MAKDNNIIKVFPREFITQINDEIFKIPANQRGVIDLTCWNYIEIKNGIYLFVGEKGYIKARKSSQNAKLETFETGSLIKLVAKEPEMLKFVPVEKFKDIDFIYDCYVEATRSCYDIIEKTNYDHIKALAIKRKNAIWNIFALAIQDAFMELAERENFFRQVNKDLAEAMANGEWDEDFTSTDWESYENDEDGDERSDC